MLISGRHVGKSLVVRWDGKQLPLFSVNYVEDGVSRVSYRLFSVGGLF